MVRTVGLKGYSDIHYTSDTLAHAVVSHFQPAGRILEPFKGGGAFLRALPATADWCEIAEGRDFFAYSTPVDWLITNPPFSNMTEVFCHAFKVADNCVFVIPISKYWSSAPRLEIAREYGGLKEILHLGRGREVGFDIGFPFAAMHFQRGYTEAIRQSYLAPSRLANAAA